MQLEQSRKDAKRLARGWAREDTAALAGAAGQCSDTGSRNGYEYRAGEPVVVEVVRRERTMSVSDRGAAAAKAGLPHGWRAVADSIKDDLGVNISRHGGVSLPIVAVGPELDEIIERIAYASLSLYQDLLELQQ